ncbi:hypothetical protein ABPG77_007162 [Micractinium sp. CCAP 211/92]
MNASEMAGEPPRPPDQRANPFPPEKPGKRALWELLTHHHPQGATVGTLSGDSRLQELWPDLAKGKSRKTKIGGELGSDRGKTFVKVAVDGVDLWVLRTLAHSAAAPAPADATGTAGATALISTAADASGTASPRALKLAASAAAAGGGGGHVVLGNTSEAGRWRAATAGYLQKHLLRRRVSVWWEGPQQFYEGRIVEILWEALPLPQGPLLLLKVLYDDKQEEWMQPTRFHVAGAQDETMVVVEQFIVYIWDPAAGRYVPDPHGGEEPPETAPDDAAAATTTAAQDDAAATAAAAASAAEAAHPAQQQQQGPARLHQQQPAGASQAVRSSGGGTRRRLAEGDRTKGRWWQQAVTGGRDASPTQPSAPGTAGASPEQGPAGGGRGEPQAQAAAGTAGAAQQPAAAAAAVGGTAGEVGLCAAATAQPAASAQAPLQQAVQHREQQQAGHSQHAVQEQDRSRLPAEVQEASQQPQQRGAQQGRAQAAPQAQRQGLQERAQRPAELLQARQGEQPAQPHQEQESAAGEAVGAAAASLPLSPRKVQPHKEEAGAQKKRRRGAEQAEQAPQPQVHVQRQPAGKRPRSDEPAAKGFTIPKRAPGTAALALPAEEAGGSIKGKQAAVNAPFRIPKAPAAGATAAGGAAVVADHLGAAGSKPPRAQQAERPEPAGEQHPQRSRPEPARRDKHDLQQQPRRSQAERRGRPEPPAPDTQLQQQQQPAEKRRPGSPPVEPASQTGQYLLRRSSSMIARNMGLVRWSIPASETALPTPAIDQAASSQPALQALRKRLAAAGPWPGDDCPLPAALPAGEALPAGIYHGRIFISKRETLSACFERCLFVSNSSLDLEGLQEGMLAVMHSLDERLVYGAFRVTAWGRRLDPSFPLPEFQHHIRVQPLRLFQASAQALLAGVLLERRAFLFLLSTACLHCLQGCAGHLRGASLPACLLSAACRAAWTLQDLALLPRSFATGGRLG